MGNPFSSNDGNIKANLGKVQKEVTEQPAVVDKVVIVVGDIVIPSVH